MTQNKMCPGSVRHENVTGMHASIDGEQEKTGTIRLSSRKGGGWDWRLEKAVGETWDEWYKMDRDVGVDGVLPGTYQDKFTAVA